MRRASVIASVLACVTALPATATAGAAPSDGRAWEPRPISRPIYGEKPPSEDPAVQIARVPSGTDEIYVETWLPAPAGGHEPPARVPVVIIAGRDFAPGVDIYSTSRPQLNSRGYAVSYVHLRGTGGSTGCHQPIGPQDVEDLANVILYLGRDAPWSTGAVGMYGGLYDGDIQLAVAAHGDDPRVANYLKAITPSDPVAGMYDEDFFDGVPRGIRGGYRTATYEAAAMALTAGEPRHVERGSCVPGRWAQASETSGDYTPYWAARDARSGAHTVRAAVLLTGGHLDPRGDPMTFFELLPPTTPKFAMAGWWDYVQPFVNSRAVHGEWARADWWDMIAAWFDEHLKGLDAGVGSWPAAQVQGSDGRWRTEPSWPSTGGPVGQLALGEGGALGVSSPSGSTSYTETLTGQPGDGSQAVFETAPFPDRLELTGQPVFDAWVSLGLPDAHIAARLEVIGPNRSVEPDHYAIGLRSAQHLDPLVDNRFTQSQGRIPPLGEPVRVQVRFDVTDLVVSPGGRLRLTVSGSTRNEWAEPNFLNIAGGGPVEYAYQPLYRYTAPSGLPTPVTIHHDCAHPSTLRFLMPRPSPDVINVLEYDEEPGLPSGPAPDLTADGGGIATDEVCGRPPVRLDSFGPEIAYP